MRWLAVLVASWLAITPAWAMEHYTEVLRDNSGNSVGDAIVTVFEAGTLTPAVIYSDNGTTLKSNPFTTSTLQVSLGAFDFYAVNGVYDIKFVKAGYQFSDPLTRRVALFDVNDGGGGGGGGTPGFDDILTGTNTQAAMIVGTGASLSTSGTGSINATLFKSNAVVAIADGGTALTSAADDALLVGNGTAYQLKVVPDCDASTQKLQYDQATNVFSCGTDQTATTFDFGSLTTGSNTAATMTVGTGASLTFSGSGSINASTFKGNATVAIADGGTNNTAATDDAVLVGNGTTFELKVIPDCDDPVLSKVLYDQTTNVWTCGVDQSAGGGVTFTSVGSGTNTTAAMVVGTGASLVTSGTGTIAATHERPSIVTVNAGNSPYTATVANYQIFCDTTAAARSITLPAATVTARLYVYNLGSNACTINRAGADTITTGTNSLTSFVINNAGSNFWLQPNGGSVWYVGG